MRELIERFTGRYEIWRNEQRAERRGPDKNPYVAFAWVAAAFLAWDIYKLATVYELPWRSISVDVLFVIFIALCVWRPQWAWLMFLIWGATMVIESPWVYMLEPYRHPARVRFNPHCCLQRWESPPLRTALSFADATSLTVPIVMRIVLTTNASNQSLEPTAGRCEAHI